VGKKERKHSAISTKYTFFMCPLLFERRKHRNVISPAFDLSQNDLTLSDDVDWHLTMADRDDQPSVVF
jgi:hypothetical protein